ncbi:UNVERIFIED_CONTAM: hypothetical protein FKN15_034773 [Acipenser sinensis]
MDRNALAELLQALESRRDAEERRREERYTALIERLIQGFNILSVSYVVPCIIGLHAFLKSYVSRYNTWLVTGLKASLVECLASYEKTFYKLADLLNPHFKAAWCSPVELQSVVAFLQQECGQFEPQSLQPEPAQEQPAKRSKQFAFGSFSTFSTDFHQGG